MREQIKDRSKLDQQVEEFLANGGKIEQVERKSNKQIIKDMRFREGWDKDSHKGKFYS